MPQLTEQQRAAVESIDHNVIVSAGAGSGKTMVLVERYLQVLKEQSDATISDIIAVTFTRKAAEEMRSRLKARLKDIAATCAAEEHVRWNALLFEVDRARIGTIHSLCESILKAYPVEAAIDPQFEVLDDLTRADLMNSSVELALQAMIGEPNENQLLLLEYPIEGIRNWMLRQLESIPQYREARALIGITPESMAAHAERVIEKLHQAAVTQLCSDNDFQQNLAYLRDNPWRDPENNVELRRREALRIAQQIVSERRFEFVEQLASMASAGTAGGPAAKPLRAAISGVRNVAKTIADKVPLRLEPCDNNAFRVLSALLGLIDSAIEHYEHAKEQTQKADYNDLIGKTHALLMAPDSVARRQLGEKIRALLVDEFQDTNHIQAELLSQLCSGGARLFLIGDDKQSIYKFQGADVSTFNHWKTLMTEGTHGLRGPSMRLDLSHSFRSHPSIVDFVNRFFSFHFADAHSATEHRARHQSLVASRIDEHDPAHVEVILYDCIDAEEKRLGENARTIEARAIATWILEKIATGTTIFDKELGCERSVTFGDFAVLVQTNGDFGVIEGALSESEIPYVTFAGSGFLHRQEVYDIENMLRWLDCPEDSHALLGILRSPFFGINDGILHKIYIDNPGSLWKCLQKSARQDEFQALLKPVAVLRRLQQEAQNASLCELIRKVITITSYDVILLSMPNGKQKSRNAWKMASFAREYSHMTVGDFLRALETMRDLGVNSHTDAPLSSEASVKLMTIHKSKGLEFPVVVLPVMGRKVHMGAPKLLLHRSFGIAFDTSRSKEDPRPSFHKAASVIAAEMDAEEKKRLLYVAMTRARDYLAMFIERGTRNDVSFRQWVMQATGIERDTENEDTNSSSAALIEGQHFLSRSFDKEGIIAWESRHAGLAGKLLNQDDLISISEAIGFDLLAAADEAGSEQRAAVNWQSLRRVTATNTNEDLHPVLIGTLFHSAMQHAALQGNTPTTELLAVIAASAPMNIVDQSISDRLIQEVLRLQQIFAGSKLSEMLQTARRVLPEIAYMTVDHGTLADRRPDLIFQDAQDNWHIVDFKTDRLSSTEIPQKMNEHSAQVLAYVNDLTKITGAQPHGWLYFAHLGALEAIEPMSYSVGKKGQLKLPLSF